MEAMLASQNGGNVSSISWTHRKFHITLDLDLFIIWMIYYIKKTAFYEMVK